MYAQKTYWTVSYFFLMFPVIPTIQHGPQVFSTIEGTPVTLPCRASGVPTPDITWAKVRIAIISLSKNT